MASLCYHIINVARNVHTQHHTSHLMLWGYMMTCSWIKQNKLAPNQNLISEKAKLDRKFTKITYPSGWHHGWSRNAKRDRHVHATFLKRNDCYTPCGRWHVFLLGIKVNKNQNTNHFRLFFMGTAILYQKACVVSIGKHAWYIKENEKNKQDKKGRKRKQLGQIQTQYANDPYSK